MKIKLLLLSFFFTIIFVLISFIYKEKTVSRFKHFPMVKSEVKESTYTYLYLYVFLKKNNCPPCLETIKELNDLPKQFKVIGVIPDSELRDKKIVKEMRKNLGIKYKLVKNSDFKKFWPNYTPTIIGCSAQGEVFFVIPCTEKLKINLKNYLNSFYEKAFHLLMRHD